MSRRRMQIRLRNDVVVWRDGIGWMWGLEGEQSVTAGGPGF